MTPLSQSNTSLKDSVNVSLIGHNEYLIEASTSEARFVSENGEYDLSLVDIKNGPKIVVGKDFFGHGSVDQISVLRTTPHLPLLLKVKLSKSA